MQLRKYQQRGINEIRAAFKNKIKKVCFVAPCGSGKTLVMANMAQAAAARGKRVLFLVHRRELITQASRTLTEYGIIHGINGETADLIQIASVQTVARRLKNMAAPDLIILDECHHATAKTWKNCLEYWGDAYVVGLTATPARLNGQGLCDVFDALVIGPTAQELILQGHLCNYKYYAPPMVANFDGVKITMGDFNNNEIEIIVNKPTVIGDAVQHYTSLAAGKQAIAYCASVEHSKNTASAFQAAGVNAQHIDGTTPARERDAAIEKFRTGEITILCNVDLIGEGFDVPALEVVILLRPTQSLTLYIQQAMRPMRPDKENYFKQAIILDHVGNVFRHGLPDTPREWTLKGVTKRQGEQSAPGVRICPECWGAHDPAPVCPYCEHVYEMTGRQLAMEAGELKEYDAAAAAQAKRHKQIDLACCKTIADLEQYAKENNYAPGWVKVRARLKHIRR